MATKSNISPAQQLANIANAMLSTGPRTEEGKAKARYNARRHGLTGQFYVMDETDRLAYNNHEKEMLAVLNPADYYERQLAISIAQDHWRLNRVKGIEFNSYGIGHHEHAADAQATPPKPKPPSRRPKPGAPITNTSPTWRSTKPVSTA